MAHRASLNTLRLASAFAGAAAIAVLCLPGRGLGGSLHQTLVAGNAANALAFPCLLLFLSRLRHGLGRPHLFTVPAAALALCLLGHFIVSAAGMLSLGAAAVTAPSGRRRAAPAPR